MNEQDIRIKLMDTLFKYHDSFGHEDYEIVAHMSIEQLLTLNEDLMKTLYLTMHEKKQ
jgi:hypothetical protein